MIEGTDYIDIANEDFNKIKDYSCVYALAPKFAYDNGTLKVGIAQNLGHRILGYRHSYAWFSKIYVFGLILGDRPQIRSIEKEIFNKFKNIRIPFTPFKGKPPRVDSEWLIIEPKTIKDVFKSYERKGFTVLTAFTGLDKAPLPNLHTKIIKKLPRGKYLVGLPDGSETNMDSNLLRKTVNIPPLKWSDPELLEWVTQKEADEILHGIVKNYKD